MHGVRNSWFGMVAAVGILASSSALATESASKTTATPAKAKPAAAKPKGKATGMDEVAVLETTKGRMVVEFWDKDAPKTVAHFKALAKSGFYTGTGFHRIMKNFMIQGGDPKSKNPKAPDLGTGGATTTTPDEFNSHGHVKGVISYASSGPNTASSQFFIVHGNASFLDGKYTAFGHVIKGMDVIDAIANTPVGPNPMMRGEPSKPLEWVTLKSVTIVPRATAMGGGAKAAAAVPASKATQAKAESAPPKQPESVSVTPTGTPATTPPPPHDHAHEAGSAPADTSK